MPTLYFTVLFVVAVVAMVGTKLWLASRQIRFVARHREQVPSQFAGTIALTAHQRAADYTVERTRLTMIEIVVGAAVLIGLTLLGGVQALDLAITDWLGRGYVGQIALVAAVIAITSAIDLPFDYYRQFVIEQRFGFNRMSKRIFVVDRLKGVLLGAAFGLPLLFVVLWLMNQAGSFWWLWTWIVWVVFQMLVLVLYPSFIAPLFNKFEPLKDEALKSRIEALMKRCGFAAKGLFVMDGSRRSAHGNAYFTGFGAAKRHRVFRRAARAPVGQRDRGRARARARPFQASSRDQADARHVRRSASRCSRCSAGSRSRSGSMKDWA